MAEYWIGSNGKLLKTDTGARIIWSSTAPPPPPVPSAVERIILIRSLIDDPIGAALMGIVYASVLPATAAVGSIWTTGNGIYQQRTATGWEVMPTLLSDAVIDTDQTMNIYNAACLVIYKLLARINPAEYVQSFNTGGQSISYPSYTEFVQHYKDLAAMIQAQAPVTPAMRYRTSDVCFEGVI